ncbi:hypothetical protein ACGYK1_18805, partial [Sulfitobacter sp. 1A13191]|uniref:hypothetical protein n=1 Tax=Sulfitobacter sp. 1A13191 TaxID=3368589 RepID=UPI003745AE2C
PISDVTHITLAHCDAVGRGYPPHQFSVTINIPRVRSFFPAYTSPARVSISNPGLSGRSDFKRVADTV